MKASLVSTVLSLAGLASALSLPQTVERRVHSFSSASGISFTYSSASTSSSFDSTQPTIANVGNVLYRTNITLGGRDITVQIDTGSTDLWVYPQEKLENVTSSKAQTQNLTYGAGSAVGPIMFGQFSIGEFAVDSQAFVNATKFTEFGNILFPRGVFGILGLGLNTDDGASKILSAVNDAYDDSILGESPLGNIFHQNKSLPNFITIMLGRSGDLDDTTDGMFTISEYIDGYENIEQTPKLARYDGGGSSRWSILLDSITVNGEKVALNSSTDGVPKGKSITVLDTGATQAQVPRFIVDAIYSSFPDAVYSEESDLWAVPCNASADVRFTFGGQEIPIHPLDLTDTSTITTADGDNVTICTSSYAPLNLGAGFEGFDMLLGDAFLRNAYALFDYGDFVDPSKNETKDAFIQLLALEDADDALSDFTQSRQNALSQLPPEATLAQVRQLAGSSSSSSDSSSSTDSDSTKNTLATDDSTSGSDSSSGYDALLSRVDSFGPAIVGLLAGNLVVGIVLCALGVMMCIRKGASSGTKMRGAPVYAPVRFKDEGRKAEDEPYTSTYND